ncbi:MAG: lysophospholipase [Myxococcota bacterium]
MATRPSEADHDTFEISDSGVRLHVHRWSPSEGPTRARLLIVHGYAEHAERYRELALHLAPHGIETVAPDLRGHGRSDGARGFVSDFDEYAADVDAVRSSLATECPIFILGHSNGGLVALDYVDRYAPSVAGLIVTNPYLELAMSVPPLKLMLGRLAAKLYPRLAVPSGIPPEVISRDPHIVALYDRDPLVFKTATVGYVTEHDRCAARVQTLTELSLPLLFIRSDADPLVSAEANARFSEKLQSPDKTVWLREGALHEVLNELGREALHADIASWIVARAS